MRRLAAFVVFTCTGVAQVRLPPYTRQILSNGAVLDVMARKDVPLITFRVTFKGGAEAEPPGLSGLANVTAEGIRRGTVKRTSEQFSRELDSLGAMFNSNADLQSINVHAEFLSKDLATGLDLLMDAILHPTFQESEMKKLTAQYVDNARSIKDTPDAAAWEYYRSFFYRPTHPYGRPADELTYARITAKDVATFHKRMFVGQNMIVAVVGDVDPVAASQDAGCGVRSRTSGRNVSMETRACSRRNQR